MPPDPFAPEANGGLLDHPALTGADGLLRAPYSQWLVESSRPPGTHTPGACVACGGGRSFSGGVYHPAPQRDAPPGPFVLPVPREVPWQSIEVHTLRFGNPDWLAECAPTLDAWCQRHGLPLHVTSSWDPSYPDPKFCEIDMLRAFLAGDSEWMLYLDADIIVHPLAPRPHFAQPGFQIRSDRYNFIPAQRARWVKWCAGHFGREPADSWVYRNAGVWACDRAAAAALLAVIEAPYHSGIMEQHHFNWWLHLASERGMPVIDLPTEWNRIPEEIAPAWFFHIYSKKKWKNLLTFREAGLLPDEIKRVQLPPPQADFGKGAVVWPWKSSAAEWDELWFSHRSVLAHWSEKDWPLVLLGDRKPDWWPGGFLRADSYEEALWTGSQCAGQVLWMNDDIFLLADQSPADLAQARHLKDKRADLGKTLVAENVWRRGLGQVLMRCHHHGRGTLDFSTHTPYLYQREKVAEIFREFGIFHKIPFETAYHNWHASPAAPCGEKSNGPHDLAEKLWINPRFLQVTPAFRAEMARRFGPPPASSLSPSP